LWIDKLGEQTVMEQDMLECTAIESTERSRLSCQIKVTSNLDGLIVHLPENQN